MEISQYSDGIPIAVDEEWGSANFFGSLWFYCAATAVKAVVFFGKKSHFLGGYIEKNNVPLHSLFRRGRLREVHGC